MSTSLLTRFLPAAALVAGVAITTSIAYADPDAIVDALKTNAGNPPQARASFARGHCVAGSYTPAPGAGGITKSASFTMAGPILGRFSVGGGNPKVADTNKAVLRGFSFRLSGGGQTTDLLVENAPVHFARTSDQMLAFLQARTPGPDGKPDADRIKALSAANPETLNQATFVAARPLPGSFVGITYWGVHAYPATSQAGETRFIKFKLVPAGPAVTLTDDEARNMPADFLAGDLQSRIAASTARLDLVAIPGRPGDPTTDVTVQWPDEDARATLPLGTIAITGIVPADICDRTVFDPANLADGIAAPPDEMFAARQPAYAISFGRRQP